MSGLGSPYICKNTRQEKGKNNILKNFGFLVPHITEFEYELQELLVEIDMLIEKKKGDWEKDLHNLEERLATKVAENNRLQHLVNEKDEELKMLLCALTW
ncbi:unnamed protein product [Heterobilharzia americana]|nr:unnamed protein product [Heterobilharzia americana]